MDTDSLKESSIWLTRHVNGCPPIYSPHIWGLTERAMALMTVIFMDQFEKALDFWQIWFLLPPEVSTSLFLDFILAIFGIIRNISVLGPKIQHYYCILQKIARRNFCISAIFLCACKVNLAGSPQFFSGTKIKNSRI